MKTKTRTKFRLALLAVACGNSLAFAGDGFIVQPKLRQSAVSKPTDVAKPPRIARLQTAVEATPQKFRAAPQPANPAEPVSILERMDAPATTVAHVVSEEPGFNETPTFAKELAEPLQAEATASSQPTVRQPRTQFGPSGLQWVTRGSIQRSPATVEIPSREVNRPLEFENPEFQPRTQELTEQPPRERVASVDVIPTGETRRAVLAKLISSQIIGNSESGERGDPIAPVDSSPGWQAVGERLTKHLQASESQLKHGAFFSAREEAEQAAVYLMRVLDLASNSYSAEPEWNLAVQALRESEDFTFAQRTTADRGVLKRIIDSHQTDALKSVDASNVSPLVAAQHYQQFAEQHLIAACQGHPWASEILYSLGRTYQAQADAGEGKQDVMRGKAVAFYRAALAVAPHSVAANQLGFVLLQMDRPQDARSILLASLEAEVSAPALENLVEVSRRLGDVQTHHWAMENLAIYRQLNPPQPHVPVVTEIDAATFMSLSPRNVGPQPQSNTSSRVATGLSNPAGPGATQR